MVVITVALWPALTSPSPSSPFPSMTSHSRRGSLSEELNSRRCDGSPSRTKTNQKKKKKKTSSSLLLSYYFLLDSAGPEDCPVRLARGRRIRRVWSRQLLLGRPLREEQKILMEAEMRGDVPASMVPIASPQLLSRNSCS